MRIFGIQYHPKTPVQTVYVSRFVEDSSETISTYIYLYDLRRAHIAKVHLSHLKDKPDSS